MASNWDMVPYRQGLKNSGVPYDQAVVLVDAINAGIKFVRCYFSLGSCGLCKSL